MLRLRERLRLRYLQPWSTLPSKKTRLDKIIDVVDDAFDRAEYFVYRWAHDDLFRYFDENIEAFMAYSEDIWGVDDRGLGLYVREEEIQERWREYVRIKTPIKTFVEYDVWWLSAAWLEKLHKSRELGAYFLNTSRTPRFKPVRP